MFVPINPVDKYIITCCEHQQKTKLFIPTLTFFFFRSKGFWNFRTIWYPSVLDFFFTFLFLGSKMGLTQNLVRFLILYNIACSIIQCCVVQWSYSRLGGSKEPILGNFEVLFNFRGFLGNLLPDFFSFCLLTEGISAGL